jgi:pyruvate/2-oxoglutarate dehydrogenase complex dihydrolipoamide dehydrogenase (E3) component
MPTTERYDDVVIGTGQGGKPLARALAGAGRSVAIIERDRVGGSCVNVGCSPTKTMVASARVAYLARRAADYGVLTGPVSVDQAVVRERKRQIADSFSEGNRRGLERTKGLELILGEASFASPNELDVRLQDGRTTRLTADRIFINTGLRPAVPSVPGLESIHYLDSTSVMELDEVPDHLLVVGGGYIGLEFGQMFRRFGARVTVVDRNDRLLHREDEDVSEAIARFLREDGVALSLGSKLEGFRFAGGIIELDVRDGEGARTLSGSHLLLAAGRRPNTESLKLERAGLEVGSRGYIQVDDRLETSVPGIYAMGDVTGGPAFTHISYDDYRIPVHGPPVRPRGHYRERGARRGSGCPRRQDADGARGPGARVRREPRLHEGHRGREEQPDPRVRRGGDGGRRAHVDDADRDDGRAAVYRPAGRDLRSPDARRVAEQPVREARVASDDVTSDANK